MRISPQLVIGLVLTLFSAHYWATAAKVVELAEIPVVYQYTFRLYPYLDILLTVAGMFLFYRGLMKLRG